MATWEPDLPGTIGWQSFGPDESYTMRGCVRGVDATAPYRPYKITLDALRDPVTPKWGDELDPAEFAGLIVTRRGIAELNQTPADPDKWDVYVNLVYENARTGGTNRVPPTAPLAINDPEKNISFSTYREPYRAWRDAAGLDLKVTYKGVDQFAEFERNRIYGQLALPKTLSVSPETFLNQIETVNGDIWRGYPAGSAFFDDIEAYSLDGGLTWNSTFLFLTTTDVQGFQRRLYARDPRGDPVRDGVLNNGYRDVDVFKSSLFATLPV